MEKKITINEIAKQLNISPTAVSFVLNNKPGVGNVARAKILKYVEEIGYKPYIASRKEGMYDTSLPLIGILYASAGGHLVDEIQSGINSVLKKTKFYELRYIIDNIHDIEQEAEKEIILNRLIVNKNIRGLIVVFLQLSDTVVARLNKKNIPVVFLNNKMDFGTCVYIDNYKASFQAVETLINNGHKNIGFMTLDPRREQVWQERLSGYKDALKKNQLNYNPSYKSFLSNFDLSESQLMTKKLLKENPEITAIVYGSDLHAYGGMMGIKEMGLKIPDDVCVIGFDDMVSDVAMEPPLSSIKQPMAKMGKLGAQMLMDQMKAGKKELMKQLAVKLDSRLITRKSSDLKRN